MGPPGNKKTRFTSGSYRAGRALRQHHAVACAVLGTDHATCVKCLRRTPVRFSFPSHRNTEEDADIEIIRNERAVALAHEGERYSRNGQKAYAHPDIFYEVEREHRRDAYDHERTIQIPCVHRYVHAPEQEEKHDRYERDGSDESHAFPDNSENKVRLLLGHVVRAGLAVKPAENAFADKLA